MDDRLIEWAPRARPHLIRKLYEADANGLVDDQLIDEVGYSLLLRCEAIHRVAERRCPHCGEKLKGAFDRGPRDRPISCPGCRWSSTWDAYHRSYKGRRIHGGRAYTAFVAFMNAFPRCRTIQAKMLEIDRLIHAVHETPDANVSPAASNLLYEKKPRWAKAFLDELAYGDQTGTEREGLREEYLRRIKEGEAWAEQHARGIEAKRDVEED